MTPIPVPPAPFAGSVPSIIGAKGPPQDTKLLDAARELEATFLSEMLKAMKFDPAADGFATGPGSDQFGSFLRDAQAKEMVQAGGIGLAEALFKAMVARADA